MAESRVEIDGHPYIYALGTKTIKAVCYPIGRYIDGPPPQDGHRRYGGEIRKRFAAEQDAINWLIDHLTGDHRNPTAFTDAQIVRNWMINVSGAPVEDQDLVHGVPSADEKRAGNDYALDLGLSFDINGKSHSLARKASKLNVQLTRRRTKL